MRQRLAVLGTATMIAVLAGPAAVAAQTADITVEPETPAPGAAVTVVVTGATPGDPVIVQLGTEEETGEIDSTGFASVAIAAPTQPGEAVGTVRVGLVDFPFSVVVQAADTGADTTTTTLPTPTSEPPVTGIDDAGTIAAIGGALLAAGLGLVYFTRRPGVAATTTRGSTTDYRLLGRRRR